MMQIVTYEDLFFFWSLSWVLESDNMGDHLKIEKWEWVPTFDDFMLNSIVPQGRWVLNGYIF